MPPARLVLDPVVQTSSGASVPTTDGDNFLGVGAGFVGPAGAYTVNAAPPDTIGAVGLNHYVQWVNTSYAIFDKATHAVVAGPLPGNATWAGVNHACAATNDGDPVVLYDRAADRWILTQLSISTGAYIQCISVSKTGDPTGEYWRYAFDWELNLNDYPKMGVWTDGYYLTTNDFFFGFLFVGPSACVVRRETILVGEPTLMICYRETDAFSSLLPANLTGSDPPPAGAPGLFLGLGTNMVHLWRLTPNWAAPESSTVTRTDIPVADFNRACVQNCVPQPGTSQTLDVLGDRLMQPLVYRNFGSHASLFVNHSVLNGSSTGIRWYEIRDPHGTPFVHQQGTYAPDANHRWMGSIGADKAGNIALGYSVGSSTLFPSIRYTGREASDPLGTMQAEAPIIDGAGSQLTNLNRWGDYSGMSIDPVDDCTFWYTTEYLQNSGTFNWSTRIALFSFPSCTGSTGGTAPDPPTGLSAAASGTTINLAWTGSAGAETYRVYRSQTSGANYSSIASGVTTPAYSDLNLAAGTYFYVVSAVNADGESGFSNETSATVAPAPAADFTLSAASTNLTVARGAKVKDVLTVTGLNGYSGTVSFSVQNLPARTTATFKPNSVTGGGTTTMTISPNRRATPGTQTIIVVASDGTRTHSVNISLTIQ
jgi:hypothetical protein